jgi:multicomponent Na+:H+ antiporter subunit F
MIAVQAIMTEQSVLLDVAIGLALVSFLGTVAFARYVQRGGVR